MNEQTDQELLRHYVERKSDSAFAALVERYIDLVHSAALRMSNDAHSAKDITQCVFVALSRNALQLTHRPTLAGWLHNTARNLAAKEIRSQIRRHTREQEAAVMNELLTDSAANWEEIAPHLDAAVGELSEPERDAVLLRYFKNYDLRTVGATLGISDDAAQKRLSRAVDRLREFLTKRGVTAGTTGWAVVVSANAVQAAPVGLGLTISTAAALNGTTLATTATATATKAIAMTALQKTVVTTTIAVLAGVGIYEARQASKLREENVALQRRQSRLTEQYQGLQGNLDVATNRLSTLLGELERLNQNTSELLRLRGEVGQLGRENSDASKLKTENFDLKLKLATLEGMWRHTTNAPLFSNPFLAGDGWTDQGKAEPIDTLQTMLWAIKQNDEQKLDQLVSRSGASQSLDSILLPKRSWERVTGVQVVDISIISNGSPQKTAVIGTILQKHMPRPASHGGPFENPALEVYRNSEQSLRRWFFVETNGLWLITGSG